MEINEKYLTDKLEALKKLKDQLEGTFLKVAGQIDLLTEQLTHLKTEKSEPK